MSTDNDRIRQLEEAYRKLWDEHIALKERIRTNYAEFRDFCEGKQPQKPVASADRQSAPAPAQPAQEQVTPVQQPLPKPAAAQTHPKTNWEEYIGEQVLSKIGIAVLVIGVGIGAKYAIDHQLLSPVMRIAGGYLIALILGFFAWRFREKYTAFSAVLLSGALAVTYFITYAGYVFYHLYPYGVAFAVLLLTTVGTVFTALRYNKVIIAQIGLVGAYVLPILISARKNDMTDYLLYLAVINAGILAVSLFRNWRSLYYTSFGWTTLVFFGWFETTNSEYTHAVPALMYMSFFFVLYQVAFTGYTFFRKQPFRTEDLMMLIPNSIVYFAGAQYVFHAGAFGPKAATVFGLLLAGLFFGLWWWFRQLRPGAYLLHTVHALIGSGLLTLTLLIELDGPLLPVLLVVQTVLLGWLTARAHRQQNNWNGLDVFATATALLTAITTSVMAIYRTTLDTQQPAFLNSDFGLLFAGIAIATAGLIVLKKMEDTLSGKRLLVIQGLEAVVWIGGFFVFQAQLHAGLQTLEASTKVDGKTVREYVHMYHTLLPTVLVAFTAVWWASVQVFNKQVLNRKTEQEWLPIISVVIGVFTLFTLSFLITRHSVVATEAGFGGIAALTRYAAFGALLYILIPWLRHTDKRRFFLVTGHLLLLWILSLEMIQWISAGGGHSAYKLSLSILWTLYAVYLLYIGIRRKFGDVRITAMVILAITLIKLFFYDVAHLSTPLKTILFIAVGGLLLVGAFFYQRNTKQDKNEQSPSDSES